MSAFNAQRITAMQWLSRQLLNQDVAGRYFDPLIEPLNPRWALGRMVATVERIVDETHDTRTFVLRPPRRWPGFLAGQHVTLALDINGVRHHRTFSLACAPETWQREGLVRITIKRTPEGLVTPWMHKNLRRGSALEISEAFGNFLLPDVEAPLLYIAGGSGITPILSHLESLACQEYTAPITLIYCIRSAQDLIGKQQLEQLQHKLPQLSCQIIHADQGEGQPPRLLQASDIDSIKNIQARHCYLCGPTGLMAVATTLLETRDVPEDQVFQTFFAPPTNPLTDTAGGAVTLMRSHRELTADSGQSLLEAAESAGLSPRFGCRMGICHQCSCRKTTGTVVNRNTGHVSGPGEETIQLCVSVPQGPVSLDL